MCQKKYSESYVSETMFVPIYGKHNMLIDAIHAYDVAAQNISRGGEVASNFYPQVLSLSNSLCMVSSNISFQVSTGPGMHQCKQS